MGKQRAYNKEYKVQAVKLAHEIGSTKAANELGIPINTLYGWMRAQRLGSAFGRSHYRNCCCGNSGVTVRNIYIR